MCHRDQKPVASNPSAGISVQIASDWIVIVCSDYILNQTCSSTLLAERPLVFGGERSVECLDSEIYKPCADFEEKLIQLSKLKVDMPSVNNATVNASFQVNREIENMDLKVTMWNCEKLNSDYAFDCYNQGTWNVTNACENLQPPWNVFSSCPIKPGTYHIVNAPFLMEVTKRHTQFINYWKVNVEVYEEGKKVACVGGRWALQEFVGKWNVENWDVENWDAENWDDFNNRDQ
uniref:(California timema) hypothetical protein n=1 Tax=Timema californicum TaxID=61474 RepID=A0A7R9J733_TIMCA|nr:unnamed protein product [Timema californicum]